MVVCKARFDNEVPATYYLQAVTDCRIIMFPKKNWEEISGTITTWDNLMQRVISRALVRKVERIKPLVSEDATPVILNFLKIILVLPTGFRFLISHLTSALRSH